MAESVNAGNVETQIDSTVLRGQLLDRRHRLKQALSGGGEEDLKYLLADVDEALARIDTGKFGVCEHCHDPIEVQRLAVDPLVRVCIECLSEEEQDALEYDLELAAQVQQTILPDRQLVTDGWEFLVHFQPAGPVSGDHFDLLRPRPDRDEVYFLLGDISGKGVSAAILGAHLQAIFRSLVVQELTITEIMERANRLFARATLASSYSTLVFGRVDSSGCVELANAGHCPSFLIHRNRVTPVDATGVPLGMFADSRYTMDTFDLTPGDGLFLYTDGLIEARNDRDEEFGVEAAFALVEGAWSSHAEATVTKSLGNLGEFTNGTRTSDDLTLLVIRKI